MGDRLLTARMAGAELEACVAAERARGLLPPGTLAERILGPVIPDVEVIVAAALDDAEPTSLDVNVTLEDGTRIVGTVPDVRGDVVRSVSFSRLAPDHRLQAWLRLLALTVARPERAFEALTVGRLRQSGPSDCSVSIAHIRALDGDTATRRDDRHPLPRRAGRSLPPGDARAPPHLHQDLGRLGPGCAGQAWSMAEKQWTSEFGIPRGGCRP